MPDTAKKKQQLDKELAELDAQIARAKEVQSALLAQREPIKSVYTWEAPERVFEPKERSWYVTVATISMVVIIFAALTNNIGLIFAVITLVMVTYALNTIPPKNARHEIMNKGLHVFSLFFPWKNVNAFWVTKRNKALLMNFEVREKDTEPNFHRLILLNGTGDLKKIIPYLVQYVDYLGPSEVGTNFIKNLTEGEYIPLINFVDNPRTPTKDPADAIELKKIRT